MVEVWEIHMSFGVAGTLLYRQRGMDRQHKPVDGVFKIGGVKNSRSRKSRRCDNFRRNQRVDAL